MRASRQATWLGLLVAVALWGVACEDGNVNVTGNCGPGEEKDPETGECVTASTGGDSGVPIDGASDGALNDSGPGTVDTGPAWTDPWKDPDGDGVPNKVDNCYDTDNPDQKDADGDGVGDACDNCKDVSNHKQVDKDGNNKGDACEGTNTYDVNKDSDGDGVPDRKDNCQSTKNADQKDPDGDNVGTACDNCPNEANSTQTNSDGMGPGDACEPEPAGMVCKTKKSDFEILRPNIYFVIDRSTSMRRKDGSGKSRMKRAKEGLDKMAAEIHDDARVGMSTFPCARASQSCGKLNKEFLKVGKYSQQQIIDSYRSNYSHSFCPHGNVHNLPGLDIETGGKHCTETGSALKDVSKNKRYQDSNDPKASQREKAVILITDGGACGSGCGDGEQTLAVRWAGRLKKAGVPVYTIGFNTTSSKLNAVAKAGGTDAGAPGNPRYYQASNANQLANVLSNISKQVISCSYSLKAPKEGIDPAKIWVKVDGKYIGEKDFTYDAMSKTVKLSPQACKDLRNATSTGGKAPLEISLGCPDKCMPDGEEICDYKDNDCDGTVDEGCDGCVPEICDGKDNDCDGTIDDGCPPCKTVGKSCQMGSECCSGRCVDDTCAGQCRPTGVVCKSDSHCCSGTCSASGGRTGQCVGG